MRDMFQFLEDKRLLENTFVKSLPTSPAYRQAGFAKGRNNILLSRFSLPQAGKRGSKGDFDASRDNGALHSKSF
jgi:hypothetical protein